MPCGGFVTGQGEGVAASAPPGLAQGVRDQRQGVGLAGGIGDNAGQQRGFDRAIGLYGGLADGPAQFVGGHRADKQLRVAQRLDKLRVFGAAGVEVGPDADHDAGAAVGSLGCGGQCRDECGPFPCAGAESEGLLELVDDQ